MKSLRQVKEHLHSCTGRKEHLGSIPKAEGRAEFKGECGILKELK